MAGRLLLCIALLANILGALSVITFESSENVTVLVRFPAALRCRAFITDNIHIPIIRWFRVQGNTLTAVDPTTYDVIEGILRFPSVRTSDVGWYLCNATSGHETNSTRLYLDVIDQLGFLTTPTNLTVNDINNLALLDCNTTNLYDTTIQFTWFNGSNPVPLGAGPNVQLAGSRNERLVIPSVQITDIGQYSCQVARIYNASYTQSITAFIYLSVVGYGPPITGVSAGSEHTISVINYEPDGDRRFELHCNIESRLTPTYVWTKDQVQISTIRTSSGVYAAAGTDILVLTHANPSDSGVYNCTATNQLGSAWRAFSVRIEEEDELLWTRWWMILIYCIIFCMFLLTLLILLIYVLCFAGLVVTRKSGDDTTQLYENTFDANAMTASPAYNQFNETGSQTWEQKFTGDEGNDEETGSQTWEKQFTGEDDDDDEKKETESGSQTWEKNFGEENY
ncbi:opioid-binding protein/cell adhesion molecule-like [Dysidea avara]|uniref:opioid-binding protein/cell adhesion molecule-like n=1 Tax=Dysidea avara TaxID=196820 RepID=UPI0033175278